MAKKNRRKQKPAAKSERMMSVAANILAGVISGLITAAVLKLLNW